MQISFEIYSVVHELKAAHHIIALSKMIIAIYLCSEEYHDSILMKRKNHVESIRDNSFQGVQQGISHAKVIIFRHIVSFEIIAKDALN